MVDMGGWLIVFWVVVTGGWLVVFWVVVTGGWLVVFCVVVIGGWVVVWVVVGFELSMVETSTVVVSFFNISKSMIRYSS